MGSFISVKNRSGRGSVAHRASTAKAKSPRARRLRLEPLEGRALLTVPASFTDIGYEVATDSQNNVYVVGEFRGAVDFDPGPGQTWRFASNDASGQDGFVAKYAPDKSLLWVKTLSGAGVQRMEDIAAEQVVENGIVKDYLYVSGAFRGTPTFETVSLSTIGTAAFVAKLDSAGNIAWAKKMGDSPTASGVTALHTSVALDGGGNLYVNGEFDGGIGSFDNIQIAGQGQDQFVAKLSTDGGAVSWVRNIGIAPNVSQIATGNVAADATGVYTSGAFNGALAYGNIQQTTSGYRDSYVIKFDSSGSYAWSKQYVYANLSSTGGSMSGAITSDGQSLFVGAERDAPGTNATTITRYAQDGTVLWSRPWEGDIANPIRDMAVRGDSLYLVGNFTTAPNFTPPDFDLDPNSQYLLTAPGKYEGYVWKIDKNTAAFDWVKTMGYPTYTSDYEGANGIAVDTQGNVLTVGKLLGNHGSVADFDPDPVAVAPLSSDQGEDVFVSKLNATGQYAWAFKVGQFNAVADNGEATYSESGTGWLDGKKTAKGVTTTVGWGGDSRYHLAGKGTNKAQWQVTGLEPGQYDLYVTWPTNITVDKRTTFATNATYQVTNGGATTSIVANLTLAPDPAGGTGWKSLGTYTIGASGSISVSLSDAANGAVIADAILLVGLGPAPGGVTAVAAGAAGAAGMQAAALYDAALAATLPSFDAGSRAAASLAIGRPAPGSDLSQPLAGALAKPAAAVPIAQPHPAVLPSAAFRRGLHARPVDRALGLAAKGNVKAGPRIPLQD